MALATQNCSTLQIRVRQICPKATCNPNNTCNFSRTVVSVRCAHGCNARGCCRAWLLSPKTLTPNYIRNCAGEAGAVISDGCWTWAFFSKYPVPKNDTKKKTAEWTRLLCSNLLHDGASRRRRIAAAIVAAGAAVARGRNRHRNLFTD